jgi:hypothetical protein
LGQKYIGTPEIEKKIQPKPVINQNARRNFLANATLISVYKTALEATSASSWRATPTSQTSPIPRREQGDSPFSTVFFQLDSSWE